MGTRTYSRRAADGSRKPTALGRRTGRFIGETRPDLGEDGDKLLTKWNQRMRDLVRSTQDIFMEPQKVFNPETGTFEWADRLGYELLGYYADTEASAQIPEEFKRLYTDIQDNLETTVLDILTSIINTQGVDVIEETDWGMRIGNMFDLLPTSKTFRINDSDWSIGSYHLPNTRSNGREFARSRAIYDRTSDALGKVQLAIDYFEELVDNPLIKNNPTYAAIVNTVLKQSKRAFNNILDAEEQAIQPISDDVYAYQYALSQQFLLPKRETWVRNEDASYARRYFPFEIE